MQDRPRCVEHPYLPPEVDVRVHSGWLSKSEPTPLLRGIGVDVHWTDLKWFHQELSWHMSMPGNPYLSGVVIESSYSPPGYGMDWDTIDWSVRYLAADSRIGPAFPKLLLYPIRVRKVPIFGKVVEVRWTVSKLKPEVQRLFAPFTVEVVRRLSKDRTLMGKFPKGKLGVEIVADSHDSCWVLHVSNSKTLITQDDEDRFATSKVIKALAPTRVQWDCLQAIARHLLETPMPTVK